MINELRMYTLKPGKLAEYLEYARTIGRPARGNERGARNVYNRIVEPKMLLWLIAAAGVKRELVESAQAAAAKDAPMATRAAAIRKHVPWAEVEAALSDRARVQ